MLPADTLKLILDRSENVGKVFDHPEGGKGVIIPDGFEVKRLQEKDEHLEFINQRLKFQKSESFIDYVQKFNDGSGAIALFANSNEKNVTAVLDYHQATNEAGRCRHIAKLQLEKPEGLRAWLNIHNRFMDQESFCEHIEEYAQDIVDPEPAGLLELASALQAQKSVSYQSAVNLHNGTTQFQYVEDLKTSTAKGTIEVPKIITLGLKMFKGDEDGYKIKCFLRFKINDEKKLNFKIKMNLIDEINGDAFDNTCRIISEKTGLTIFLGEYLS